MHKSGRLNEASESGVHYWGAIYIPVVVAMAMTQNVVAAVSGGPMALIAATVTVVVCGLFVAFINRLEIVDEQAEETYRAGMFAWSVAVVFYCSRVG